MFLREHRIKLRAAERKWCKSNDLSDLTRYQSLLSSFSTEVHTAKSSHFHNKINSAPDMRNLFRTFNYLLCPPPPPPTTSITADDFATFFTDKTRTISNQFSPPHTQDLQPTTSTAQTTILQHVLLTQSPLTFSKQSLPHAYRHSHTLSTYLSALSSSPQRSSRLG